MYFVRAKKKIVHNTTCGHVGFLFIKFYVTLRKRYFFWTSSCKANENIFKIVRFIFKVSCVASKARFN